MTRPLPLLILCAAANAAEVAQFRAENFGAEWRATRGDAALVAVHPATNGWAVAFADRGGVSFSATNGVASPLAFDPATTGAVARVLLVADCNEARPWASLLDAPVGAALAPRAFDWNVVRFATSNCLGTVAVSVDGLLGAEMPTNGTPYLVEIAFPSSVPAADLYLGGHPATPAWNRSWRGRVFEALFCFGEPSVTDADALRSYLSLRWRLALDFDPPPDIAARLRALGVDPGALYTTRGEDLPVWFIAMGYPATDADESGIPDCWEKWTHTRGFAAEADPDGDGLSNLDEFEAQTDPIRADTDGDGIDDATELAGLAAGVADLNPLVAATFVANEPDADGDGIPDIWEAAEILSFDGFALDGFPWGIDVPEPAATNFDVTVHVSSSRHAALSWGDGWGESILLPPCTNLALRLRLAADGVKTLALSPGPDAATSPVGTWRAALVADWDLRRGFPTEIDRLALPDGTMVDRSERESIVSMAWMQAPARRSGEPLRGGRGGRKPEITFTPRRVFLFVENDSFCSIHGPAPTVRVVAENASPPYVWTERGVSTTTQTDSFMPSNPYPDGHYEVSVVWPDEHETLFLQAPIRLDPITCRPGQTNFVGAGWTSTHNPTNAADHAPGVVEVDRTFGPLCPVAHDVDVRLGWTHDTAILWIRNLVRIVTGDPMDDETDHCISLPFSQTGEIDLYSYLDGVCLPYRERFVFKVNGLSLPGHTIHMSDYRTDNNLKPSVLHVSFSFGGSREMDRMWIVLYSSDLKTGYDSWKTKFSGLTWTTSLPPVYPSIALSTNGNGAVSLVKQDYPGWERPHAISSYLHHDAVYEMRSESVGIHGHQATYRADGTVIETTLAAGTADYSHPLSTHAHWPTLIQDDHYVNDVVPFLRALSLDGNPGIYNSRYIPTNLTRPCLYQGININEYILRRPTFPTGKH